MSGDRYLCAKAGHPIPGIEEITIAIDPRMAFGHCRHCHPLDPENPVDPGPIVQLVREDYAERAERQARVQAAARAHKRALAKAARDAIHHRQAPR